MGLILKLEGMAGDNIFDAAYQMVDLAEKLNIIVQVEFNDVLLLSYYGGNPEELVEKFRSELKRTGLVRKRATTHGRKQYDLSNN